MINSSVLNRFLKDILVPSVLILAIAFCFFFSPKPGPGQVFCGEYISINSKMGYVQNCDAITYISPAQNLPQLLNQHEMRQSRPLFVLLAAAVIHSADMLLSPVGFKINQSIQLSFVGLNFVVLLLSLWLLQHILVRYLNVTDRWLILLLQAFLVSNQVTKAFFWTIHQQMFTFLAPLVCCYLAFYIHYHKPSVRQLYLFALAGGLLMLVYGNFLLILPVLLFFYLKNTGFSLKNLKVWLPVLVISALFLAPTIAWVLGLKAIGIRYYNHEMTAYRQLTWIIHSLLDSFQAFWLALVKNTIAFLKAFQEITAIIALALAAVIITIRRKTDNTNLSILLICLGFYVVFFWLLGFYPPRLTFNLLPILLLITGLGIKNIRNFSFARPALLLFFLGWHAYNVLSYGHFG